MKIKENNKWIHIPEKAGYWDAAKQEYVIYLDSNNTQLLFNTVIQEDDGVEWNVYLESVKYLHNKDIYRVIYKEF